MVFLVHLSAAAWSLYNKAKVRFCDLPTQVEKEAQDKRKAEEDKKKQEQQAKKDAEAKVGLPSTMWYKYLALQ